MKVSKFLSFSMLAATVLCLQSCNDKPAKQNNNKNLEKIISGKYTYLDKNNVYHIDEDCIVLTLGALKSDETENTVYSVKRIRRGDEMNWEEFASHHQLCSQCFTDEILDSLESHQQ